MVYNVVKYLFRRIIQMKNNYNKSIEELDKEYQSNINGLTNEEAYSRLQTYGENKLKEKKKKSNIIMFLEQFNDFMIILLIFASIFSAVVPYIKNQSYFDSIIIIIIVFINAILSFIQEKKAAQMKNCLQFFGGCAKIPKDV